MGQHHSGFSAENGTPPAKRGSGGGALEGRCQWVWFPVSHRLVDLHLQGTDSIKTIGVDGPERREFDDDDHDGKPVESLYSPSFRFYLDCGRKSRSIGSMDVPPSLLYPANSKRFKKHHGKSKAIKHFSRDNKKETKRKPKWEAGIPLAA